MPHVSEVDRYVYEQGILFEGMQRACRRGTHC